MYFYCHPCTHHLSTRKVLPFSEFAATFLRKQTPICNPIVRIFIVTQIAQITQIFFRPPDSFSRLQTTTITTITTFNGDIVAKGRVVLVVIVVHIVVNSKFVVVNSMFLSLTISVTIRVHPMLHIICEICEICVTKKLPYYLAVWEIVRNFAAETC